MRTIRGTQMRLLNTAIIVAFLLISVGSAFGQVLDTPGSKPSVSSEDAAGTDGEKEMTPLENGADNMEQEGVDTDASGAAGEERPSAESPSTPIDEQYKDEIEALVDQKIAGIKEEYDARLEELELNSLDDVNEEDMNQFFRVFGFSDVAFMWRHIEKGSFFKKDHGIVNTSPQFLLQHLNLYFSSQMTQSLSFLTEVQFSFLPNGATLPDILNSERVETTVVDPYTQQQYRWGSIIIQRAWLKWEPFQFFGVKLGYFLTPYGIWHEDHASTVRLSILPPFEADTVAASSGMGGFKKPIPAAQLGLQLFGRLFPHDNLRFDYAFTVSNGRGPADTVVDYDDNKGLGLRLKLTYSTPKVEVALGGYGYFGEYTNKIFLYMRQPDLIENYKEYAGALDFQVSFFGIRIQAEYLRNLTRYSDEGRLEQGTGINGTLVLVDYVASMFYAMLAYQLPLDRWLGGIALTPYVGVELNTPMDSAEGMRILVTTFGLNIKPTSFVALKLEGSRNSWVMQSPRADDETTATVWTVAGQVAVSF